MMLRRISLTIVGFAAGALAAIILCASAQNILSVPAALTSFTPSQTIQFPYVIPNTTLVILSINAYDGPFLEDGTDREVLNVAALVVQNIGEGLIESAFITMHWGDGFYSFSGSYIPAGAKEVLLERNGCALQVHDFVDCTASQTVSLADEISGMLIVTENDMGTIVLMNPTDSRFCNFTIYYKTWLESQNMYIGGITYAMGIAEIQPKQTLYVYPDHFAVGYSKIVSIQE